MATLSVSGLDDLLLSLEEVAALPAEVQDEMLLAAAEIVAGEQKETARDMGVEDTGDMIKSIQAGKIKVKDGVRHLYIYPQGTRVRGSDGKGRPKRIRNAAIAFINEYGTRKQPARPFVRTANEKAAGPAAEVQAGIYDKFLKSKGL